MPPWCFRRPLPFLLLPRYPRAASSPSYLEPETADVFTGACFANGEAEQVGREAVFGWRIDKGEWRGVNLAGLSVVGVVRSEHTLGLTSEPVNPAKSVLIVDSAANAEQRLALQSFAKHMGGELLKDVVKVDFVPISLTVEGSSVHNATAKLSAGSLAEIQTRAMTAADHVCGNEDIWYPPLNSTGARDARVHPGEHLRRRHLSVALGTTA